MANSHVLRVGDRVHYVQYRRLPRRQTPRLVDDDPRDLGTVCEVCENGAVVVAWDTGDVDEVTRTGRPRSDDVTGVRWTGKRWTPRRAARHLRLAVEGELDNPDHREAHGFKVYRSERYAAEPPRG